MSLIGVIKWYNHKKGFGLISTMSDGDYFIHHSDFSKKPIEIKFRTLLIFTPAIERNKKTAKECHQPENVEDLLLLSDLIGKEHNINFVFIKNKVFQIKGSDKKRKNISVNLLNTGLHNIFGDIDDDAAISLIKEAYLKIKEEKSDFDFIAFVDFVPGIAKYGKGDDFLEKIYHFFGENISEEALFQIWKHKKFEYIEKTDFEDYEIPENILIENIEKITCEDLIRIKEYENGAHLCNRIIENKIAQISNENDLSDYLQFVSDEALYKSIQDKVYKEIKTVITEKLNELREIKDSNTLQRYEDLYKLIPEFITKDNKQSLKDLILKAIKENSTEELKVILWLKDIQKEINLIDIIFAFSSEIHSKTKKTEILSKAYKSFSVFEITKLWIDNAEPIEMLALVEAFIKENNFLGNGFNLKSVLYDDEFKTDKLGFDLAEHIIKSINEKCSKKILTDLYFDGWLNNYPEDYVLFLADKLNKDQCLKILKDVNSKPKIKFKVLQSKSKNYDHDELKWVLKLCIEFLSEDDTNKIQEALLHELDIEKYFELWKFKHIQIIPEEYLKNFFNENAKNYSDIDDWLRSGMISESKLIAIFLDIIGTIKEINNRKEFYTIFNIIKKSVELNEKNVQIFIEFHNEFYNLILWHLLKFEEFNFDTLKGKYIYFSPDDQVTIFKRLFYLKHARKIDFTFEELDEILRADINLYLINENFQNDFVLDISTHILIEAIKSYKNTGNFLFESDLILKDLTNNKKKKFKVGKYFDKCPGRMIAEWNWKTNGTIDIETLVKDNKEYTFYRIDFEYDEYLVSEIKKLPGKRFNYDEKYWAVPLKYKDELFEFARKHRFKIQTDSNYYSNNTHLAEFKRSEIPNGIKFCEGRIANNKHKLHNIDFWWCTNQECFQNSVKSRLNNENESKEPWIEYTLFDFLNILNIKTDEFKQNTNEIIPNGHYYMFLGHINAFNRLLEHLYCEECGELLYPMETSHFALYRDVRFKCINETCSSKDKVIYLNHCLYGECKTIIDSRVSKQCENGLYICENCGTCCSNEMFKRKKDNLDKTGGYVHPNLMQNIEQKKGHLEKSEYYCYKCSNMMTEVKKDHYICESCDVEYDLSKFKWLDRKWTMKEKRRQDYPVKSAGGSNDFDEQVFI